ncbi:TonB-dependent receptor [Ferruginibacter yonginensis]|uniref:TonB-dependent receptor n=1 Tax=Ferruginibacter yonginensis TaxID=1310416 RepID=A0ABV8QS51_9BACT
MSQFVQRFFAVVFLVIVNNLFQLGAVQAQVTTLLLNDAVTGATINAATVTVYQQNTSAIVTTNNNGVVRLTNVHNDSSLHFTIKAVGYSIIDTILFANKQHQLLLTPQNVTLQQIVITGVSKSVAIKQHPIAIVSVQVKTLAATIEPNIIDALVKNVPGLQSVKTGPNISKPFIRGLGYNRVLTMYDGVRQEGQQWGDEHGIEIDEYSIEKAEVIKGPASIMYGSDALAGVINLIPTKVLQQDGRLHIKATNTFQTNNGQIGTAVTLSSAKKNISFIMNSAFTLAKNYQNKIDGRVYNTGFKTFNVSGGVQLQQPASTWRLHATLYDNLQGIPDGSRDSLTRKFSYQVYEAANDDIKNRPIVQPQQLNSYTTPTIHQRIQHYRIYSNNQFTLGKHAFQLNIAAQQNIRTEFTHPTVPQQPGLSVQLNTLNYALQYNIPTLKFTHIAFGINGMAQKNTNKNATDFPIPNYWLFDVGSYFTAHYIKNKFTSNVGIRYDKRLVKAADFYVRNNIATGFDAQVQLPDTAGATLQFPYFNKSFDGVAFSIGCTYQFNEHWNIKVNAAKGYRAPNITELASNGLDPGARIVYLGNLNFKPEFSFQQDVGVDYTSKNLKGSLSLFNNVIQHFSYLKQKIDQLGSAIVDAQGNRTFQYEQAKAQLFGGEAAFNWAPTKKKDVVIEATIATVYGYNKDAQFKNKKLDGAYLPLIHPTKITHDISKIIPFKKKYVEQFKISVGIDYTAKQRRYLQLNNTETATNDYTLFNAAASTIFKWKSHTLQCQLQINNLFNKAYQSHLSRLKYLEYYQVSPNNTQGIFDMGTNISCKFILLL